ncbi:hypothetical protein DFQ29_006115 [Apophysomyces sp. BC1021]|nr:hypothetical protein DFQ29_006115 [Apophysomyces sp. BC1021]
MYLSSRITFIHPPTYIEYKNQRFLILDAPAQTSLPLYIQEFERWNVTDVVRCCEATYSRNLLQDHGIRVHDCVFADGEAPSARIVNGWLNLIAERFILRERDEKRQAKSDQLPCIATHCVAGLGRAPVLVAIALIEKGMEPLDSIAYIRERRQGAINTKQLEYIASYKPRSRDQISKGSSLSQATTLETKDSGHDHTNNGYRGDRFTRAVDTATNENLRSNDTKGSIDLQPLVPVVSGDQTEDGQTPLVVEDTVALLVIVPLRVPVPLLVAEAGFVAVGVGRADAVATVTELVIGEAASTFVGGHH